jgi:hypothetical protein
VHGWFLFAGQIVSKAQEALFNAIAAVLKFIIRNILNMFAVKNAEREM